MALLDCESFTMSSSPVDYVTYGRCAAMNASMAIVAGFNGRPALVTNSQRAQRRLLGLAGNGPSIGGYSNITHGIRILVPNATLKAKLFLWDGVNNSPQLTFVWNGGVQRVEIYRGGDPDNSGYGSDLLGASALGVFPLGAYFHSDLKGLIATGTGGSASVRINEIVQLALTGVNTQNTSRACIDTTVHLDNGPGPCFQDMVWLDNSGSENNDFIGDVGVFGELANAAGSVTDLASSTANANYVNAGTAPPLGDAGYNYSATVGAIDRYGTANPANVTQEFARMVSVIARKDDTGTRDIAVGVYTGTTESLGSSQTLSSTYTTYSQVFENNPATSVPWLPTDTAQVEVKVAA